MAGNPSSCIIKVCKQNFRALVDTGADISLIHSRVYKRIKNEVKLQPVRARLQTVNGNPLIPLGRVSLSFRVGTEKVEHSFLVVDDINKNIILGRDFCTRQGVRLYYDLNRMRVGKSYIPLEEDGHYTHQIRAARKIILRPREGIVVRGKVSDKIKMGSKLYTVQPPTKGYVSDEPAIRIENSVGKMKMRTNIPVLMMNSSDKTITIKRGFVIGNIDPLTEEEAASISTVDKLQTGEKEEKSKIEVIEETIKVGQDHREKVMGLVKQNVDLFAQNDCELGHTKTVTMKIDTGDHKPIKLRPYRAPLNKRDIIDKSVAEMEKAGVIRRSRSPWSFPLVLVKKKDDPNPRMCVDYRQLNKIIKQNSFPLPRIDDILDKIGKSKYFSTLDLKSGYWQVLVDEKDIEKTAFVTQKGLYEFTRMPFGISTCPQIFSELMAAVLEGLEDVAIPYLDDVIVLGESVEEHMKNLEIVFDRLRKHGLKMKLKKCEFFRVEVSYLGFIVSADGIKPDPSKVSAIQEMAPPTCVKEVRGFVGVVSYYRRFMPKLSALASPLYDLTKKNARFKWTSDCQTAFEKIKELIAAVPILAYPDTEKAYTLYTDASDNCIGAVLTQEGNDGEEKPLHFLSHRLSGSQTRWSTVEKEAYAIHFALGKLNHYLQDAKFTVKTDHKPLKYLLESPIKNRKIEMWALSIAGYPGCKIEYLEGRLNAVADLMSRSPGKIKEEQSQNSDKNDEVDISDKFFEIGVINSNRLSEKQKQIVEPNDKQERNEIEKGVGTCEGIDMQKAQENDPEIKNMKEKLLSGKAREGEKSSFIIIEGLVYYISEVGEEPCLRLWVPKVFQKDVLEQYHDSNGHMGVDKVYDTIRTKYYWVNLYKEITEHVASCLTCKLRSGKNCPPPIRGMEVPAYPFAKVSMDISGPYPITLSGNKYILSFVDHYSGWPEAFCLPDKSAQSVAHILLEYVFPRFGCPLQIVTDNGTENVNKIMKEVCGQLNIEHITTSFYHPQSNAKVERFHRTLHDILTKKLKDDVKTWDIHLNQALAAIRFNTSESSSFSPFFLLYNRDVVLPVDNILKPRRKYHGEDHHQIALENQHKYFTMVHKNVKRAQKRQRKYANKNKEEIMWEVGDPVLFKNHHKQGKLENRWLPFYRIVEKKSPSTFVVRNQVTGHTVPTHAEHIRPAPVEEWTVPESTDSGQRRSRRTQYVAAPSGNSEGESTGSSDEDDDNISKNNLEDWYKNEREDSNEEENVPIMELTKRMRRPHALLKKKTK